MKPDHFQYYIELYDEFGNIVQNTLLAYHTNVHACSEFWIIADGRREHKYPEINHIRRMALRKRGLDKDILSVSFDADDWFNLLGSV